MNFVLFYFLFGYRGFNNNVIWVGGYVEDDMKGKCLKVCVGGFDLCFDVRFMYLCIRLIILCYSFFDVVIICVIFIVFIEEDEEEKEDVE